LAVYISVSKTGMGYQSIGGSNPPSPLNEAVPPHQVGNGPHVPDTCLDPLAVKIGHANDPLR
jgi:hypothetical protein